MDINLSKLMKFPCETDNSVKKSITSIKGEIDVKFKGQSKPVEFEFSAKRE